MTLRIALSLLGAGAFYALWMALAIPGPRLGSSLAGIALVVLAPIFTATGYSIGMVLGERFTLKRHRGLVNAWLWPFIGCSLGTLVSYPAGPMLIVFGMFALGVAAILLREIRLLRR